MSLSSRSPAVELVLQADDGRHGEVQSASSASLTHWPACAPPASLPACRSLPACGSIPASASLPACIPGNFAALSYVVCLALPHP